MEENTDDATFRTTLTSLKTVKLKGTTQAWIIHALETSHWKVQDGAARHPQNPPSRFGEKAKERLGKEDQNQR